jgi:ribokinase
MAKKKIVVIGSFNTDMILSVDHLPKPGETILGGEFNTSLGGKGANQAVSAARAGAAVTFIARLGNDSLGNNALAAFRKDRIDVKHIIRDDSNPSGVALILVSKTGQNCIAVAGGANNRLSALDIKKAAPAFTATDFIVLQLETPLETVQAAVIMAVQKGIPIILNPAPAQVLPDSILQHISILTPNETEAELLTGIKITDLKSAALAAALLLKRGVQTVIITLGAKGAWVATKENQQHVPGFRIKAVDATAAGDTFTGALAVASAEGKTCLQAVRFGHAAAALSAMKRGAQVSIPKRKEIDAFLQSQDNQSNHK